MQRYDGGACKSIDCLGKRHVIRMVEENVATLIISKHHNMFLQPEFLYVWQQAMKVLHVIPGCETTRSCESLFLVVLKEDCFLFLKIIFSEIIIFTLLLILLKLF